MPGKAPTPLRRLALATLVVGVVFAMPLASAFGMGIDAASVNELKNAGATPKYGQTWVGNWMNTYGWGGFESDLRTMRDAGVTPVIMWYFYGDSISPGCVQYGCDGRTKGEWDAMAKELAQRADAIMDWRPFYVVLEPEFQKNGIEDWETFDGHLETQARIIKANAPHADTVVGFGHWGGWERFDRAVAASDMVGFQVLRGSTRDSSSVAIDSADYMIRLANDLKADFGKPIMVFDLGIATYGNWGWVQEKALQDIIAKRPQLDAAGVEAIIWRYLYDNDHSSGYFGAAESSWGVKYEWGGKKAAYDEILTLIKGAPATPPSPTAPSLPTTNPFIGVKGNEWWIESKVANGPSKVETRVNGGSWIPMSLRSWGAYAVSTHATTGSTVELRATYPSGTMSASYRWPSATLVTGGSTTPTDAPSPSTPSFDASFRLVKLNEWWQQVDVDSAQTVSKVEVRVADGAWQPMKKASWGDWTTSVRVPTGTKVEFRATTTTGATNVSGGYYR